ncbi:MAG: peptidylprolyl isomerase [Nostocaceae cyanobacterium]|nr:peptidylprolyl isomerase [Nostocaceae cyanobacterium]
MTDLLRVAIEPQEIVNFLKSEISLKEAWQKVLFQRVIKQAAEQRGIIVTPEEIQAEANRQRRDKRLERASDTVAWLAEQLISADDWEIGIHNSLLSKKLSTTLFAKEVEKFFAQNRLDFEQIILYQIIVSNKKLAQEIFYQLEEGEISFYEAAHLYDIDEIRRQQCGYQGKIYRFDLKPDVAAVLFTTQPKKVVAPIQIEQDYYLFLVEDFIPAELTTEKYQDILDKIFQEWLAAELNYLLLTL